MLAPVKNRLTFDEANKILATEFENMDLRIRAEEAFEIKRVFRGICHKCKRGCECYMNDYRGSGIILACKFFVEAEIDKYGWIKV